MGKYLQGFKGMRQDINESNMDPNYYYYAQNLTTSTTNDISNIGGIGNIQGDELLSLIPTDGQLGEIEAINGGVEVEEGKVIIFVYYTDRQFSKSNSIYLIDASDNSITSIYKPIYNDTTEEYEAGLLGFTTEKLTIIHNKENELINTIYWIDGINQVRSLNLAPMLRESNPVEYITTPIEQLDAVTKVSFSNIQINGVSNPPTYGGSLTSGRVQYAYSYFNKYGQSSGISPLSEIISISTVQDKGGELNEVLGQNNNILIDNIDINYDIIQLYRVKYNTLEEEPEINLIQERLIDLDNTSLSFLDVGTDISSISSEEFLFLGSDIYTPKSFEIKDDRMFIANFEESTWDIGIEDIDCRAYKFLPSSPVIIRLASGEYNNYAEVPNTDDCIPESNDLTNQRYSGSVLGATGDVIRLKITSDDLSLSYDKPYYRSGEIYRFGIKFFNSYGKSSTPQWICDYQMPDEIKAYKVEVEFDSTGLDLEALDIQGYQIVRLERKDTDKIKIASGVVSPTMFKYIVSDGDDSSILFDSLPSTDYTNHSKAYIERQSNINKTVNYPIYTHTYPQSSFNAWSAYVGTFTIINLEGDFFNGEYSSFNSAATGYADFIGPRIYTAEGALDKYSILVYNFSETRWEIRYVSDASDIAFYYSNDVQDPSTAIWTSNAPTPIVQPATAINVNIEYRKAEGFDTGGQSILNHTSILSGSSDFDSRMGYKDDVVPCVNSAVTDIPLSKGIDTYHTAGNPKPHTFINSKLWQIHSPEITFETAEGSNINKLSVNSIYRSYNYSTRNYDIGAPHIQGERYRVSDKVKLLSEESSRLYEISDDFDNFTQDSLYWIPDSGDANYNRQCYNWDMFADDAGGTISYGISRPTVVVDYDVYGTPLIMEDGDNSKSYNNNSKYKVSNNLYNFTTDTGDASNSHYSLGINSVGSKCMFIIPTKNGLDPSEDLSDINNHERIERVGYDTLNNLGFTDLNNWWNFITIDLKSSNSSSTIYGGNTYEARSRNSYISIGDFVTIDNTITSLNIEGTGDTYYSNWTYSRSNIGELEISSNIMGLSENISVPIESYIDLDKRDDITAGFEKDDITKRDISSLSFESNSDTYSYNNVYNREPNFFVDTPASYLEDSLTLFPNLIRASKQKVPGELQNSFFDILVNEETSLPSKYGPINKLKLFRDSMYVYQENAVSYQSINPRAQVIADDGLSVELGTGTLFGSDKYLTTESGLSYIDRFSVVTGNNSMYYFDRMNKSINTVSNNGVTGLSEAKFVSKLVRNKFDKTYDLGVLSGFDFITNNLFMAYPTQDGRRENIVYNEVFGEFISIRTGDPDLYIQSRDGLLGVNNSYSILASTGVYLIERDTAFNTTLGADLVEDDIKLTTLIRPKEYSSARYDSLEWKSINRGFDNNPNVVNKIQTYNEEQDSGLIETTPRNKFDMWRLNLPRGNNKKIGNRLNGRWLYVDMYFINNNSQFNIYNIGIDYANKI